MPAEADGSGSDEERLDVNAELAVAAGSQPGAAAEAADDGEPAARRMSPRASQTWSAAVVPRSGAGAELTEEQRAMLRGLPRSTRKAMAS